MREVKSKEAIAAPSLEVAHSAGSVLKLCQKAWLRPEYIVSLAVFSQTVCSAPRLTVSFFQSARMFRMSLLLVSLC